MPANRGVFELPLFFFFVDAADLVRLLALPEAARAGAGDADLAGAERAGVAAAGRAGAAGLAGRAGGVFGGEAFVTSMIPPHFLHLNFLPSSSSRTR